MTKHIAGIVHCGRRVRKLAGRSLNPYLIHFFRLNHWNDPTGDLKIYILNQSSNSKSIHRSIKVIVSLIIKHRDKPRLAELTCNSLQMASRHPTLCAFGRDCHRSRYIHMKHRWAVFCKVCLALQNCEMLAERTWRAACIGHTPNQWFL